MDGCSHRVESAWVRETNQGHLAIEHQPRLFLRNKTAQEKGAQSPAAHSEHRAAVAIKYAFHAFPRPPAGYSQIPQRNRASYASPDQQSPASSYALFHIVSNQRNSYTITLLYSIRNSNNRLCSSSQHDYLLLSGFLAAFKP